MDEGTRTGGPVVSDHKRRPEQIREEIEHTREELGATVEELAARTDVKAQARARAADTKRRIGAKLRALEERADDAGGPPLPVLGAIAAGVLLVVIVARR